MKHTTATLGRTLAALALAGLTWGSAGSARAQNTAVCDAGNMKGAAKYCSAALGCWSKWVKGPEKDPGNLKLDACLAKSEDKAFASALKAEQKAAKKGGTCSIDGPGAMRGARTLADAISGAAQFGWDPLAFDKADNGMRSGLLKAFGKLCGKSIATRAKYVAKPDPEKEETAVGKLLLGFEKTAEKTLIKADKAGVALDQDMLEALFSMVQRTSDLFTPPEPVSQVVAGVTAGSEHSCLWREDGSVSCWGRNDGGQASPLPGMYSQVSAGGNHSCGVLYDGRAKCWGSHANGKADPPPDDFWMVSAGTNTSCGVRIDDDGLSCWGSSLGTPPAGQFWDVSVGSNFACATRLDGSLTCWGPDDTAKQLDAPPGTGFFGLSSGFARSCALGSGSAMSCWGENLSPLAGQFYEVAVGGFNTYCATALSGQVDCWSIAGASLVPPTGDFFGISAGGAHACALSDEVEPTAVCWGDNASGQTDCSGIAGCGGGAAPTPCLAIQGETVYPPAGSVASLFLTITKIQGSSDYLLIISDEFLDLFESRRGDIAEAAEFFDRLDTIGPSTCNDGSDHPLRVTLSEQEVNELVPQIQATEAQFALLLDKLDEWKTDFETWMSEVFFKTFYSWILGTLIKAALP